MSWKDDVYQANINIGGKDIDIRLDIARDDLEQILPRVHKVIKKIVQYDKQAKKFACGELLDLKNSNWLEEGEKNCTAKTFQSSLNLIEVSFFDDEAVSFEYEAEEFLFWEHGIQITMDENNEFIEAELVG